MAFESIPSLGIKFREVVPAEKGCPRMCKHKYIEPCMKGFPLEDIYEVLGSSKDITSILEPDSDEKAMLAQIIDDDVDDGIGFIDPIIDSWRERLTVQRKKIWFKDMYEQDLASRNASENVAVGAENEAEVTENVGLKEAMEKGYQEILEKIVGLDNKIEEKMSAMDDKITDLGGRVIDLENCMAGKLAEDSYKDKHHMPSGTPMDLNDGFSHQDEDDVEQEINAEDEEKNKKQKEKEANKKKKKNKKQKKVANNETVVLPTGTKRVRKPSSLLTTPFETVQPAKRQKTGKK